MQEEETSNTERSLEGYETSDLKHRRFRGETLNAERPTRFLRRAAGQPRQSVADEQTVENRFYSSWHRAVDAGREVVSRPPSRESSIFCRICRCSLFQSVCFAADIVPSCKLNTHIES